MKLLSLISFLIPYSLNLAGQNKQYVVIDEIASFTTIPVGSLNLRINKVSLSGKVYKDHNCDIFNFYFSKNNFNPKGLDGQALSLGSIDYNKLNNDILITFIPLTDSINLKVKKLSNDQLKKINIITYEELLQKTVLNLYKSFVKNEISYTGDKNYIIKTRQYGIIIKSANSYFLVDAPVLTLDYLIDDVGYISAVQYHDGEINIAPNSRTKYYNLKEIDYLYSKSSSTDEILRKTLPEKVDSIDNLSAIKYNSIPINSVGAFYFATGIGIINGVFDYSSDNVSRVNFKPDNFIFSLKSINNTSIKDFIDMSNKKYPFVIKSEN